MAKDDLRQNSSPVIAVMSMAANVEANERQMDTHVRRAIVVVVAIVRPICIVPRPVIHPRAVIVPMVASMVPMMATMVVAPTPNLMHV
jgi:hypothetical protein